jgi:hypothetical protein
MESAPARERFSVFPVSLAAVLPLAALLLPPVMLAKEHTRGQKARGQGCLRESARKKVPVHAEHRVKEPDAGTDQPDEIEKTVHLTLGCSVPRRADGWLQGKAKIGPVRPTDRTGLPVLVCVASRDAEAFGMRMFWPSQER